MEIWVWTLGLGCLPFRFAHGQRRPRSRRRRIESRLLIQGDSHMLVECREDVVENKYQILVLAKNRIKTQQTPCTKLKPTVFKCLPLQPNSSSTNSVPSSQLSHPTLSPIFLSPLSWAASSSCPPSTCHRHWAKSPPGISS